ncbi:uncharacterized protein LOC111688708 [Lucilia cuprina]|uniref:uncharacterized protein LOC111688708 n=1 Tax=Lucilia cuprina TaxID=7375 RepID=UPI001F0587BE|nr:uncharacterized protein LOC111688708 [Lucilia cuprina]
MSFKTTSSLAPHYPNTYMEQFCKSLHPDLELGTICLAWFRQAIKHCTELLTEVKPSTTFFWTTVKQFIFPDRTTELLSQNIPIRIHPKRLSVQDCNSLFLDIVRDYIERAPRYGAETKTNVMLWQVLYSLMGIMTLGSLLVGIIFTYYKYGQSKTKINLLEDLFTPESRMQVLSKRSLNFAKSELRNIHIKPVPREEDIVTADGDKVLALKIGTKYEFFESLVTGSLHSIGKLHRFHEQYSKTKTDFKIESLNKALKFVDNNCKKIHLLLMFEQNVAYEEEESKRKTKINSPRVKNTSPPVTTATSKGMLNTRLEGGGFSHKTAAGIGIVSVSSRSNSPKPLNSPKQGNTPRSSAIPCKRAISTRKSK